MRIARLVLLSAGVAASAGAPLAAQTSEGERLMQQESAALKAVCGMCHNLQIVLDARMSYGAWHDTVQSMIDRGAAGSDEQLDDIMDYLHRNLTTINVNAADGDELGIVLEAPDEVVKAIIARRKARRFENLADLENVSGINRAVLDTKARQLFFN